MANILKALDELDILPKTDVHPMNRSKVGAALGTLEPEGKSDIMAALDKMEGMKDKPAVDEAGKFLAPGRLIKAEMPTNIDEFVTSLKEGYAAIKADPIQVVETVEMGLFPYREEYDPTKTDLENAPAHMRNVLRGAAAIPFILPAFATGVSKRLIGEPVQRFAEEWGLDPVKIGMKLVTDRKAVATSATKTIEDIGTAAVEEAKGFIDIMKMAIPYVNRHQWREIFTHPEMVWFGAKIIQGSGRTGKKTLSRANKIRRDLAGKSFTEGRMEEAAEHVGNIARTEPDVIREASIALAEKFKEAKDEIDVLIEKARTPEQRQAAIEKAMPSEAAKARAGVVPEPGGPVILDVALKVKAEQRQVEIDRLMAEAPPEEAPKVLKVETSMGLIDKLVSDIKAKGKVQVPVAERKPGDVKLVEQDRKAVMAEIEKLEGLRDTAEKATGMNLKSLYDKYIDDAIATLPEGEKVELQSAISNFRKEVYFTDLESYRARKVKEAKEAKEQVDKRGEELKSLATDLYKGEESALPKLKKAVEDYGAEDVAQAVRSTYADKEGTTTGYRKLRPEIDRILELKPERRKEPKFREQIAKEITEMEAAKAKGETVEAKAARLSKTTKDFIQTIKDKDMLDRYKEVFGKDVVESVLKVEAKPPKVEPGIPLRPESIEEVTSKAIQVGEGWTKDRGTMPGEPIGTYKNKYAVVERFDAQDNVLYEVMDTEGQSHGVFQTIKEAKSRAEKVFAEAEVKLTIKVKPAVAPKKIEVEPATKTEVLMAELDGLETKHLINRAKKAGLERTVWSKAYSNPEFVKRRVVAEELKVAKTEAEPKVKLLTVVPRDFKGSVVKASEGKEVDVPMGAGEYTAFSPTRGRVYAFKDTPEGRKQAKGLAEERGGKVVELEVEAGKVEFDYDQVRMWVLEERGRDISFDEARKLFRTDKELQSFLKDEQAVAIEGDVGVKPTTKVTPELKTEARTVFAEIIKKPKLDKEDVKWLKENKDILDLSKEETQAVKTKMASALVEPGFFMSEAQYKASLGKIKAYFKGEKPFGEKLYTGIGLDPQLVGETARVIRYHIESGVKDFYQVSQKMLKDVGEKVRPYLKPAWTLAQKQIKGLDMSKKDLAIANDTLKKMGIESETPVELVSETEVAGLSPTAVNEPGLIKRFMSTLESTNQTLEAYKGGAQEHINAIPRIMVEESFIPKQVWLVDKFRQLDSVMKGVRRTVKAGEIRRVGRESNKLGQELSKVLELEDMAEAKGVYSARSIEIAKDVRKILDEIYSELDAAGIKDKKGRPIEWRKGYLPHMVKESNMVADVRNYIGEALEGKHDDVIGSVSGGVDLYGTAKPLPTFGHAEKRTGAMKDYERNPLIALRRYVLGASRILYDKPGIVKARAEIEKIPDGPMKDLSVKYIKNYMRVTDSISGTLRLVDAKIGRVGARSVLAFSTGLQTLHLGRVMTQVWPELGTRYSFVGLNELIKSPLRATRETRDAGLLPQRTIPYRLKFRGEVFDNISNYGDAGNTIAKTIAYQGYLRKINAEHPDWSFRQIQVEAVKQTMKAEGVISQATKSIAMEKVPKFFLQFKYWFQKYTENAARAVAGAVKDPSMENMTRVGRYMVAAAIAEEITRNTGLKIFHITPYLLQLSAPVLGFFKDMAFIFANANVDIAERLLKAFKRFAQFAIPGGISVPREIKEKGTFIHKKD